MDYNYLDELNEQQKAAVSYLEGPSLVIAGAGSGKTRVLTYKLVHLIHHGFEPYRILALTFTNKAAREMKDRVTQVIGEKVAQRLRMGTFHSVFLGILRQHADKIGFKSGFTIYDSTDSRSLLKMIVKELDLDEKVYKPSTLQSVISNAKNALITADQYILDNDNFVADRHAKRPLTGKIFKIYSDRCRLANAMDFDDILVYMNLLLRDNADIRHHYQSFFRYILVDEYQDTNFAQHLIISQLSDNKRNVCVVGDDAQSIYSFRGADINNILNLERSFPGLRIFKLERNYRSTQNIIDAAGSLIEKNTKQLSKKIYSENEIGQKVEVISAYSDFEESFIISNLINQHKLTYHDSYEDYAILYRTNSQSRVLEESLRKRGIPYRIYGGLSFYQRKEVKDAIAYFRLTVNPDDDESLKRIINYPARGIGETTLKKLSQTAISKGKSLWSVITSEDLKGIGFNSGTVNKLKGFQKLIEDFIKDNDAGANAFELGQMIYNRTGILTSLAHDTTPESISRQENLSELLAGLKYFVDIKLESGVDRQDMQSFLSEVMLATDQDVKEKDNEAKVTLMTVHAAKGLEFRHVYIVGVEEDLFPAALSQYSLDSVEEERRLLYVAITRAKETCVITYAGSRFRNGQTVQTKSSRFISDINPRYLKMTNSGNMETAKNYPVNPTANYRRIEPGKQHRSAASPISQPQTGSLRKIGTGFSNIEPQHKAEDLKEGTKVCHDKFGIGIIKSIGNISGESSVTVEFEQVGIKRLLLRFAKFKIIGND